MTDAKKQILVVDDDPDLLNLIATALRESGYDIMMAGDGHEALMLIDQHHFDLALVDIMMPRIDGLTLVKALKSHNQTKLTPVIIITAKTDTQTFANGVSAGAAAVLHKPFRIPELLFKVSKHIA